MNDSGGRTKPAAVCSTEIIAAALHAQRKQDHASLIAPRASSSSHFWDGLAD